jgi:hypothetical protein
MTIWYAVWDEIIFIPPCISDGHPQTVTNTRFRIDTVISPDDSFIPPYIADGHRHRVTNTRCRIDIVISPDDGHIVARNM